MSISLLVFRELDIFFSFTWRDLSASMIAGSIFAVGAMRGLPVPTMIKNYLFLISWLIPHIYFFNLSNQITGVAEDKIDKPDRPIPQENASWKSIAPHTAKSTAWIYTISVWVGITSQIQDLRDIEGDASIGRKTMPLVFGDWEARMIISFVFIPTSLYILHLGHILEIAPWTLIIPHIVIAYRVLYMGGVRYDHKTYMYYTYIFCLILAVTSFEGVDFKALAQSLPTMNIPQFKSSL
ncbi:hypothetical protein BDQ17DRAFT_1356352 [Cyathus striatus]|nr:hypothetical protein BDQ17DRAFT_1356352 [Cyathus striatus]